MGKLPKIIVVLGPTASGKTDVGIFLAKKFNGEIVSADSRLVYKEMDIGTAKPGRDVSVDSSALSRGNDSYSVESIPHHLIDVAKPDEEFSLSNYKVLAIKKIDDILSRGKLPIIVGGTGLYIWSIIDNLEMPAVAPNPELRKKLEQKTPEELVADLEKIDPDTAKKIDLKNPRRVLRALEVRLETGNSFFEQRKKGELLYDALQIGLDWSREELNERINTRVTLMMKEGLLEEVRALSEQFSWKLPSMSGIGYKQIGYFLRGEMPLEKAVEEIKKDTRQYAKRQMTWFKRDKRIIWMDKNSRGSIEKLVQDFLKK